MTHPTLTRTGAALGTAAYMSPEQVRGEPLDARSDLFSFGIVLYEMATGRQAFAGDTAEAMNDAILNRSPAPVRQVNSEISPRLESVISKALEKDRAQRYQSAAEMRAEFVRQQEKRHPFKWALACGLALALLASALFWFGIRQSPLRPELKETQITASSSDNNVHTSTISPDGKYLAYSDVKGVHLKLLSTGETQMLSQVPSEMYFAWFPDSTRFLGSQSFQPGIWAFSVIGGAPHQFREDGTVSAVSPDGSLVAFTTNKGRVGDLEIWLIGSDGANPRMFLSVAEDSSLQEPAWSPDGRRFSYFVQHQATDGLELRVESRDLHGGPPVVVYSEVAAGTDRTRLNDFVWLPGGRMIFSLTASDSDLVNSPSGRCNLWELRIDPSTGRPLGPMQRLTNWFGSAAVSSIYATADGKQLSVLRMANSVSVYLADSDMNTKKISAPARFTATEGLSSSPTWAADGQSIYFESDQDGQLHIFNQKISENIAQPVPMGAGEATVPVVSPDGAFLLYLTPAHPMVGGSSRPVQLMRVPATGGAAQHVLTARIYDSPRCARAPASLCAIAEPSEDRKQMIFTAFDPAQGRGRELTRIDVDTNADYGWDLSPDGVRIAVMKRVPRSDGKIFWSEGLIHIISLTGEPPRELRVKGVEGWSEYVDWAADGRGFILTNMSARPLEIVYVDLEGNMSSLWRAQGARPFRGVPSPDGRHIAILCRSASNNVWLLENF